MVWACPRAQLHPASGAEDIGERRLQAGQDFRGDRGMRAVFKQATG